MMFPMPDTDTFPLIVAPLETVKVGVVTVPKKDGLPSSCNGCAEAAKHVDEGGPPAAKIGAGPKSNQKRTGPGPKTRPGTKAKTRNRNPTPKPRPGT